MQTTISKWGNSLAVRLPRHAAEEVRLVEGVSVNVEVEDGSLRITPSRRKFNLTELLKDEPQKKGPQEVDWGGPEGEEVW